MRCRGFAYRDVAAAQAAEARGAEQRRGRHAAALARQAQEGGALADGAGERPARGGAGARRRAAPRPQPISRSAVCPPKPCAPRGNSERSMPEGAAARWATLLRRGRRAAATYQGAAQKSICEEHLKELAFLVKTDGKEAVQAVACPLKKIEAATFRKIIKIFYFI